MPDQPPPPPPREGRTAEGAAASVQLSARLLATPVIALISFGLGCAVTAAYFLYEARRVSDAQAKREADAERGRERMARAAVTKRRIARKGYKTHHGDYPEKLDALLRPLPNGRPGAFDDPAALTDPWQRPYVYEAWNRNPLTGVPRVYSPGADPSNPQGRISNW